MNEKLIQFGDEAALVGTVTLADSAATASPPVAFIFFNSGFVHRVGPHRLNVRLARYFARSGYPSLRFDFSSLGDSARAHGEADLRGRMMSEIKAALTEATIHTGAQRFVLVGLCSGTDPCIWAAMEDPRIGGVILMDPFAFKTWRTRLNYLIRRIKARGSPAAAVTAAVRSVAWTVSQKLRRPKPGAAAPSAADFVFRPLPQQHEFEGWLQQVLTNGVHMLVLYTGGFPAWYNYAGQFKARHGTFGDSPLLTYDYIPQANHTFTDLRLQKQLFQRLLAWTRTFA